MSHPFKCCKYDLGHRVHMGLGGGRPGVIVKRAVIETRDDVIYRYLVEFNVWNGVPQHQWFSEGDIEACQFARRARAA